MNIPLYMPIKATGEMVLDAMKSAGDFSGVACRKLEEEICTCTGASAARAVHSISSAFRAVLYSWSVCKGEAVFVPSFAPANIILAVLESGALPVFVDCDRDTWCMSAQKLESAVKKCVKANELYPRAAIVSDLFGMPFECAEISRVCAEYGLLLIEDASSAMGSVCKGRKAGTLGDASVISFPSLVSSNIQGDSAVVLTDDVQLAKNIKLTVNGGEKVFGASTGAKETVRRGETSVMDDLTASLLHMNISETDKSAEKRRRNAELLKKAAEGTSVKFQIEKEGVQGAYPVFTLCAEDKESAERMVQAFRESGIESRAVYSKPLCRHAAFKELGCQISDVPVGSELSVCTFLLPCHEKLTDKEVEYIGEKIKTICV